MWDYVKYEAISLDYSQIRLYNNSMPTQDYGYIITLKRDCVFTRWIMQGLNSQMAAQFGYIIYLCENRTIWII